MSAQSDRRPAPSRPSSRAPRGLRSPAASASVPAERPTRIERRRREQHLRRVRHDLLEDVTIAVLLMIVALIVTAGLGVIAIIEVPIAGAVIGSYVLERVMRRRRRTAKGPPRRPVHRGR